LLAVAGQRFHVRLRLLIVGWVFSVPRRQSQVSHVSVERAALVTANID
jgi:hypothetical protein